MSEPRNSGAPLNLARAAPPAPARIIELLAIASRLPRHERLAHASSLRHAAEMLETTHDPADEADGISQRQLDRAADTIRAFADLIDGDHAESTG